MTITGLKRLLAKKYDYSFNVDPETGCEYVKFYPKWYELAKLLPPDSRLSFLDSLCDLLFDTNMPIPIKTVLINTLEQDAIRRVGNK